MRENIISVKQNAEVLRDYAFLSYQHCFFVLNLCEICKLDLNKLTTDKLSNISQAYHEIKENCDAVLKKKYALGSFTVQTDTILLKNIIANFNLQSIELINELNNLAKEPVYIKINQFLKHMCLEQKQFLEKSYTMMQ